MAGYPKSNDEPVFRTRIRDRDSHESSFGRRLLGFLNSSLGLFVLSTVFLSGFSWIYNTLAERQQSEKQSRETERRLTLELRNRLTYLDQLAAPMEYNDYHAIQTAIEGFTPGSNVNPSWIPHYSAVFPEFQSRSLLSLFWELEALVPQEQRAELENAHDAVTKSRAYFRKLRYRVEEAPGRNAENRVELLYLNEPDLDAFRSDVLAPLAFIRTMTPVRKD